MPTLRINLLGPPTIYIGEHTCKIRSKKAAALLFYCLLFPPVGRRLLTRRHLCDIFWPEEQDETRARKNLSDTLWLLKDDLQKSGANESQRECLRGSRDSIEFHPRLLCFAISDFGVILSGPIPPTTCKGKRLMQLPIVAPAPLVTAHADVFRRVSNL